jgi:hypothetical protein
MEVVMNDRHQKTPKQKSALPLFHGFTLLEVLNAQELVSVDLKATALKREEERKRGLDLSEYDNAE